jgi:predicted nucleic acid-binding protein
VTYLDTSSLVALYYPEAKTARLEAHLRRRQTNLPFTWIHELEFTNSLHLKVFRGEGTSEAVADTLASLRADIEAGNLFRASVSWPSVFEGAVRLANAYSSRFGTRSLDLLHVSTASLLNANEFVTSDRRQSEVARREGLKVVLLP